MIEFITYQGEKYPVRISYYALNMAAMEFVNGDITYSELCDEYELIEEMFVDEEGDK